MRDALGEQLTLRQLDIALVGSQPDEVGVRGQIGRVAQQGEVPQRGECSGGVTGEREGGGERVGHPAVRGPKRLPAPRPDSGPWTQ